MIEQAKFTYSPLEKAFEKQTKTIEDAPENQRNNWRWSWKTNKDFSQTLNRDQQLNQSVLYLRSNFFLIIEAKDKLENNKKMQRETNRDDLIYKKCNKEKSNT